MNLPEDLKYATTHEWVKMDGDTATVGITDHAQEQLGELVYVELPDVGQELQAEASAAVVESVKAASDVYSPLSGVVVEVNDALDASPETLNAAPYEAGWLFKLTLSNASELDALMDAAAYRDANS